YDNCDKYILSKYGTKTIHKEYDAPINFDDLVAFFREFYWESYERGDDNAIEKFLKEVQIFGYVENEVLFSPKIIELISIQLSLENKYYFLLDGKWFFLNNDFMENVNKHFLSQVTSVYDNSGRSEYINNWPSNYDEKEYNFSHNEIDNIFVLDRMLIKNIEICDLLNINNNEVKFIHVKKGLAGDTRVLCAQIMSAMSSLQNAVFGNDADFLSDYYQSIRRKCFVEDELLRESAEKFINQFNEEESFTEFVFNNFNNMTFVLAFSGENYDLHQPAKTITSTPAKISLIQLVQKARQYGFKLEILKINEG